MGVVKKAKELLNNENDYKYFLSGMIAILLLLISSSIYLKRTGTFIFEELIGVPLVDIHIGLGFIVFAEIIFVGEMMRSGKTRVKGKALAVKAGLLPMGIIYILLLIGLIGIRSSIFSIVLVSVFALFLVRSLSVFIENLFNIKKLNKLEEEQLENDLLKHISILKHQRKKTKKIEDLARPNIVISKSDWISAKEEYHIISHEQRTGSYNIDVNAFEELVKKIKKFINNSDNSSLLKIENGENTEIKRGEKILFIPKKANPNSIDDTRELDDIKKQLQKALYTNEESKESFKEYIEEIFAEVNKEYLEALQLKNVDTIRKINARYYSIIKKIGDEKIDIDSLPWEFLEGIAHLVRSSLETKSSGVIEASASIIYTLADLALEKKDEKFFRDVLSFSSNLLYPESKKEYPSVVKKYLLDYSHRLLDDYANFGIIPKYKKSAISKNVKDSYSNFTIQILNEYSLLFIRSIKNNDFESFGLFIESYKNELFSFYESHLRAEDRSTDKIVKLKNQLLITFSSVLFSLIQNEGQTEYVRYYKKMLEAINTDYDVILNSYLESRKIISFEWGYDLLYELNPGRGGSLRYEKVDSTDRNFVYILMHKLMHKNIKLHTQNIKLHTQNIKLESDIASKIESMARESIEARDFSLVRNIKTLKRIEKFARDQVDTGTD